MPTFAEAGFTGVEASAWFGIFGPAGLPPAIVERLNGEIVRGLKVPEVHTRLTNAGYDPMPSSPAELAEVLKTDLAKWIKVVKSAGLKPE